MSTYLKSSAWSSSFLFLGLSQLSCLFSVLLRLQFRLKTIHRSRLQINDLHLNSPRCLDQEIAKRTFGLRVKLPSVYHTRWEIYTVTPNVEREKKAKGSVPKQLHVSTGSKKILILPTIILGTSGVQIPLRELGFTSLWLVKGES